MRRAGRPFLVRRTGDGAWIAVELACRHQNADLSAVAEREGLLVCPRHGSRFDLRTGNALSLPAYLPVETYPVRVRDDGMIVIEVGE